MRHVHHAPRRTLWLGMAVALAAVSAARAEPHGWLTGAALEERLSAPVTVSWLNTPLARSLGNLSTAQHIAIVLDRRIDPDQEISMALVQEPLRAVLRKIAEQLHVGYCQLGPVAYLGPEPMARRLRTLAAQRQDEVRKLPQSTMRKLSQPRGSQWDDLAEPRKILGALAAEVGVKVAGAERIPHDLWRAADLPPLSWTDRLTLLASQFDLTFQIESGGRQITLVTAPAKAVLSRTYPVPRQAEAVAKRWAEALPTAQITAEENKVRLVGSLEEHEFVERRLRGNSAHRSTTAAGKEVYSLAIENAALNKAVEQVGQRLGLEFRWDRAAIDTAGIAVDQLISVKVQDASLDELLGAVLKNTGLTFRRKDRAVSIHVAGSLDEGR